MPDPANARIASIQIDIQPADPDQPPIDPRAEQSFPWSVKSIRPIAPLLDKSTYDTRPERLILGEQLNDEARCQVVQPVNT
jgi:hypothetical protein